MTKRALIVLSVLSVSACSGQFSTEGEEGSDSQGLMADLRKHFRKFELVRVDGALAKASIGSHGAFKMIAGGQEQVLELQPHDLRSARYVAIDSGQDGDVAIEVPDPRTYKGVVRGAADSQVRLSFNAGDELEGYVALAGERTYLQPARAFSQQAKAGDLVLYPQGALIDAPAPSCAEGRLELGKAMAPTTAGSAQATGTLRALELATDADSALVSALGAAGADQEILQILNLVDGVYERELGITIEVVFQHSWTTPDPYNGSTREVMLGQFQAHWNGTYGGVVRDAAHLFSRRPAVYSATSIGGVAFLGVVCNTASAYGLSGLHSQQLAQYALTAHEIGHNLGANHAFRLTPAPGYDIPECATTIMQDINASQLTFCSFSRQEVTSYVAAAGSCLATVQTCVPSTCQAQGANCGSISDGCGGTLQCGSCSGGQTCGGGGQPNVCGSAAPAPYVIQQWGMAGDVPLSGNFYGGPTADLVVRRPSDLVWYMTEVGSYNPTYPRWGYMSDVSVVADFLGTGNDQLAQWRDSDGFFYILDVPTGVMHYQQFGMSGDVPFGGRLFGDGSAEVAIYRPATGELFAADTFGTRYEVHASGVSGGAEVFGGDFLGNGHDQAAIYQSGRWTIVDMLSGERATFNWGTAGDIPVPGPILSARHAMAVWRPSDHTFYVLEAGGASATYQWGQDGDLPLVGKYLQTDRANVAVWRPGTGEWFILR